MQTTNADQVQARLLRLAFLYLGLFSLAYSLAPMVRLRSLETNLLWQHWIGLFVWAFVAALLHRLTARLLPDRDPYLLPVGLLLSGWGLLTIFRLSPRLGFRQTAWLVFAGALIWLVLRRRLNISILQRYKYVWLVGGLILTGLTLVFGTNPLGYGPRLWLGCCGFYLQPSEPLKLLLVTFLSAFLADRKFLLQTAIQDRGDRKTGRFQLPLLPVLAPTLLMTGLALAVMVMQRDLGAATIFLFLYAVLVYLAVHQKRVLWMSLAAVLVSGILGVLLFDVVRVRVEAWLDPWTDPSGRSYQIVQSVIAVANGGLVGQGPGLGSPGLVPIAHSDFIFTAVVEESGLLGGLGLLAIGGLLAHRGLRTALRARDPFHRLMAGGLTAYLVGQMILIIGGNLRVLPLTGVTLPFVSYGGSSLVTSFLALLSLLLVSSELDDNASIEAPISQPFQELNLFLLAGLAITAVTLGWWSIVNSDELLQRTDNARRAIADRFVPRGNLYDRQGSSLAETSGEPGSYSRSYAVPSLGPVVGYTHPVYGQAGLEAALDGWLRGLEGYDTLTTFTEQLLYGQPPPGLNLRLTLDKTLHEEAVNLLETTSTGAVVVLDPASGELLAIASQPGFDPNRLDQDWENLIEDPSAPFLNRASLGLYPVGSASIPFSLTRALESGLDLAGIADSLGGWEGCAVDPAAAAGLTSASAGCASLADFLAARMTLDDTIRLNADLSFYQAPQTYLPALTSSQPDLASAGDAGEDEGIPELQVSPLQMAVAAGALSNAGTRPAPSILLSIENPAGAWDPHPPLGRHQPILSPISVKRTVEFLQHPEKPIWHSLAVISVPDTNAPAFSWYISGTLKIQDSDPRVVVVLLEANDPIAAYNVGMGLWESILTP